jgi:hypothetical protein
MVVYTPQGGLCPKRELTSRLRGSDGAEWFIIPAKAGTRMLKLNNA